MEHWRFTSHDYPFDATVHDMDSSEDDGYLYGVSDEEDEISPAEFDDDLSGASDHSDLDHFDYYQDWPLLSIRWTLCAHV